MNMKHLQATAQLRYQTEQTPDLALTASSKAIQTLLFQQAQGHERL